jgi:hypothetical protein
MNDLSLMMLLVPMMVICFLVLLICGMGTTVKKRSNLDERVGLLDGAYAVSKRDAMNGRIDEWENIYALTTSPTLSKGTKKVRFALPSSLSTSCSFAQFGIAPTRTTMTPRGSSTLMSVPSLSRL